MLGQSEFSLNDILVELGYSSGVEANLDSLSSDLNKYSTGASHSADSFRNFQGFTGGDLWHFLKADSAVDYGSYVRVTFKNWATVDNQEAGSCDWEIYDSGLNYLNGSNSSVSSTSPGNTTYIDCGYSSGTPDVVRYRFANGTNWNYIYL